ncbi:hypothetical protein [Tsukamurella soli]|uniref:hypothetical protein n=1 Tax=Tsukamurella soli TaxID=644556 RepID=UPI003615D4AD
MTYGDPDTPNTGLVDWAPAFTPGVPSTPVDVAGMPVQTTIYDINDDTFGANLSSNPAVAAFYLVPGLYVHSYLYTASDLTALEATGTTTTTTIGPNTTLVVLQPMLDGQEENPWVYAVQSIAVQVGLPAPTGVVVDTINEALNAAVPFGEAGQPTTVLGVTIPSVNTLTQPLAGIVPAQLSLPAVSLPTATSPTVTLPSATLPTASSVSVPALSAADVAVPKATQSATAATRVSTQTTSVTDADTASAAPVGHGRHRSGASTSASAAVSTETGSDGASTSQADTNDTGTGVHHGWSGRGDSTGGAAASSSGASGSTGSSMSGGGTASTGATGSGAAGGGSAGAGHGGFGGGHGGAGSH